MKYLSLPFRNLKPKYRAIFILHISGFKQCELSRYFAYSQPQISRIIQRGYDEYPSLKSINCSIDEQTN